MPNNSLKLDFNPPGDGKETHVCDAFREGYWIFYCCKVCPHRRKLNWRTKEMRVIVGSEPQIFHSGCYTSNEYREAFEDRN